MEGEPYRSPASSPPSESGPAVVDEATRLGIVRSVHRPPPLWRTVVPAAIVPVAVTATFLGHYDPAIFYVGLAFGFLVFAILAVGPLRRRGLRLEVHAHGIVVVTPRKRDAIVFEDIDELWYDLDVYSLGAGKQARIVGLRLVDRSGVEHRVPLGVADAITAFQWVVRHCSDPLLADAQAALRAGETLTFGDVRIDRDGITFGKAEKVAWKAIRLARMQSGSIALFKKMPVVPWRTIRLDRVPHPTLFAKLFRELAPHVEIDDPLSKQA